MKGIVKKALSTGLIIGLIIFISEFINFKIRGDEYNIFIYCLIVGCVAVCALFIIIILHKLIKVMKRNKGDTRYDVKNSK